ncbi:unnamed protein product [Rhizophagus irregularis]|nr:unnamed protein product [Rhizophagus irregularis]
MGQCFSSTRAIQKLPIDDIKEMPDIVRNGFTFSDGIENISFSLAKNVDEYGISISLADLVKAGFLRNNDRYLMNFISLFDRIKFIVSGGDLDGDFTKKKR